MTANNHAYQGTPIAEAAKKVVLIAKQNNISRDTLQELLSAQSQVVKQSLINYRSQLEGTGRLNFETPEMILQGSYGHAVSQVMETFNWPVADLKESKIVGNSNKSSLEMYSNQD